MRVSVERRGSKLWLRGTLPPKSGSDQTKPYRQKLSLGVNATSAGVQHAEKQAKLLSAQLDTNQFDWKEWGQSSEETEQVPKLGTVGDWIAKFEAEFRPAVESVTWKTDYHNVLKHLNSDQEISVELLRGAIARTKPNTRTRRRFTLTLSKLAQFAGLEANFKALQGSYSATQVDPRNVPDDRTLAEGFYQIKDPGWRWVYGMLVTFGLRNHEVFYLATEELEQYKSYMVTVLEGKTGSRLVWGCYPEWIEQFSLMNKVLPNVTGKEYQDYGQRVTKFFERTFSFTALDVRHRWAIRTLEFGLPYELSAMQMGHSVKVHEETYHRWITADTHQKVYNALMLRNDRPRPPEVNGKPPERS